MGEFSSEGLISKRFTVPLCPKILSDCAEIKYSFKVQTHRNVASSVLIELSHRMTSVMQ